MRSTTKSKTRANPIICETVSFSCVNSRCNSATGKHRSVFGISAVVDIMRVNVDKVLERDQKLSELDDRADALQAGASQFESSAAKLKNKYWWKNCKMMIIMAVIGVICVGVIFWTDAQVTGRVCTQTPRITSSLSSFLPSFNLLFLTDAFPPETVMHGPSCSSAARRLCSRQE
ncbi:hypothetical protein F2P81_022984 [Scophthalmus maximus]|uniref:V-SNARE coiled-coil homology domain-containing protein n=1 Tax=Scophthalmus maximus TaxID=52904 RepID=A0A6A4RYF3_SCOMX|nr:hypothetical protein F2P81_022984 [Scophthalmus maximus]